MNAVTGKEFSVSSAEAYKLQQTGRDFSISAAEAGNWQQDGVLVYRNFLAPSVVSSLNEFLDELWRCRDLASRQCTIDAFIEQPEQQRTLFRTVDAAARRSPYKLNDLYLDSELIRSVCLAPELCEILGFLLAGDPLVCNSLNFEFGSEQDLHIDSQYMTPRVANKLVVSWLALDDVSDSNGPVVYYPGSHLIPPYRYSNGGVRAIPGEYPDFKRYMQKEIEARGLEPVSFHASPGDLLIWHSQIYHGGSKIIDQRMTRRALVTHYFRRQDYYHQFWRHRKVHNHGYYLKRRHPATK